MYKYKMHCPKCRHDVDIEMDRDYIDKVSIVCNLCHSVLVLIDINDSNEKEKK